MLTRIVNWLLPQWAKNPLLDYEWFQPRRSDSRRAFALQLLALAIFLGGAALLYAAATAAMEERQGTTRLVWQSLYFPTLILQWLTAFSALLMGAAAFDAQRQGNTWDNLRVTEIGAGLALRARWTGIHYRLRAPIAALLIVRLILALGILFDLTAFGGHYVDMLSAHAAATQANRQINILSIALSVAASALLPLSMIASFTALGILLGVAIKEQIFVVLIQFLLLALLVLFVGSASYAVSQVLQDNLELPELVKSLLLLGYSSHGDWGLSHMQLNSLGAVWQSVSFGLFVGAGLAGLALAQALIADGMISLSERISERQS